MNDYGDVFVGNSPPFRALSSRMPLGPSPVLGAPPRQKVTQGSSPREVAQGNHPLLESDSEELPVGTGNDMVLSLLTLPADLRHVSSLPVQPQPTVALDEPLPSMEDGELPASTRDGMA